MRWFDKRNILKTVEHIFYCKVLIIITLFSYRVHFPRWTCSLKHICLSVYIIFVITNATLWCVLSQNLGCGILSSVLAMLGAFLHGIGGRCGEHSIMCHKWRAQRKKKNMCGM